MFLFEKLSPLGKSVIESFVRQRTKSPESFHLAVSPEDEMYMYHVADAPEGDVDDWFLNYVESGALMIDELRPIFDQALGGFGEIDSLLEFACGHGRFTRYLIQEIEPERISVSDIYADAVEFQRKEFGVRGQVSVLDPEDFHDDRRYDCILVCSLFSHLPERTFTRWLERLYGLLTESGTLIFTVHDASVAPNYVEMTASGIGFLAESESRALDRHSYGTSFVSEEFCRNAIDLISGGNARYARVPRGLWRFQDVYVVSRHASERLTNLAVERGLEGNLDFCRIDDGMTHFVGWAHDFRDGESVDLVEILEDGKRAQICLPLVSRVDVANHFDIPQSIRLGWSCMVDEDRLSPTSIISVRLTSSTGERIVVAFNSLEKIRSLDSTDDDAKPPTDELRTSEIAKTKADVGHDAVNSLEASSIGRFVGALRRAREWFLGRRAPLELEGFLDDCRVDGGRTHFLGWAHDFRVGERVESIEILEDGEPIEVCMPSNIRADVAAHFEDPSTIRSGWACRVEGARLSPTSVVSVRLTSTAGDDRVVASGALETLVEMSIR